MDKDKKSSLLESHVKFDLLCLHNIMNGLSQLSLMTDGHPPQTDFTYYYIKDKLDRCLVWSGRHTAEYSMTASKIRCLLLVSN